MRLFGLGTVRRPNQTRRLTTLHLVRPQPLASSKASPVARLALPTIPSSFHNQQHKQLDYKRSAKPLQVLLDIVVVSPAGCFTCHLVVPSGNCRHGVLDQRDSLFGSQLCQAGNGRFHILGSARLGSGIMSPFLQLLHPHRCNSRLGCCAREVLVSFGKEAEDDGSLAWQLALLQLNQPKCRKLFV